MIRSEFEESLFPLFEADSKRLLNPSREKILLISSMPRSAWKTACPCDRRNAFR